MVFLLSILVYAQCGMYSYSYLLLVSWGANCVDARVLSILFLHYVIIVYFHYSGNTKLLIMFLFETLYVWRQWKYETKRARMIILET